MGNILHPERATGTDQRLLKFLKTIEEQLDGDYLVVSGNRGLAQQQALYAQGRTAPGHIVTNADSNVNTAHGHRGALDVVPMVNGKPFPSDKKDADGNYEDPDYPVWNDKLEQMQNLARAEGLECGQDWPGKLVDRDHFQVPDWKSLPLVP